jgi:hypothetical protein
MASSKPSIAAKKTVTSASASESVKAEAFKSSGIYIWIKLTTANSASMKDKFQKSAVGAKAIWSRPIVPKLMVQAFGLSKQSDEVSKTFAASDALMQFYPKDALPPGLMLVGLQLPPDFSEDEAKKWLDTEWGQKFADGAISCFLTYQVFKSTNGFMEAEI